MKAKEIRLIYQGEHLCLYEILFSDENGNQKTYEMVSRIGSKHNDQEPLSLDRLGKTLNAIVLFVLNKNRTKALLPIEFRMSVNQYVIGNIAGLVEPGETAEEAARRELFEETGLELLHVDKAFPASFICSGMTDEAGSFLICTADGKIRPSDSIYEEIHAKWITKSEAREILQSTHTACSSRMQLMLWMWAEGLLDKM